jgi:demethylmenaquinone methyltransferase/2-methoxy-6-polyprenyl-1,4-benzoquinol methylase
MPQDTDSAARFYTRVSHVYDSLADAGEHVARELGLRLLDARPGDRVLEIGFGTGGALVQIARAVSDHGRVIGVDIAEGMGQVAADRVAAAGLSGSVSVLVAAVPPIPSPDQHFDAVFMAFTLELFPDDVISAVLLETRRVLRPGGRFVVVAMDEGNDAQKHGFAERAYQWLHRHFPHIIDCRPIDVDGLLKRAGFTVSRVEVLEIWGLPVKVCVARQGDS